MMRFGHNSALACIAGPLRRVHECVFAVLAMETEPVDPRL
jgi:protein phosphatase